MPLAVQGHESLGSVSFRYSLKCSEQQGTDPWLSLGRSDNPWANQTSPTTSLGPRARAISCFMTSR